MDAISTKKIGKYEITGILGRGGMGVVYRAEDKRIGRQVAIKTLTEGFSGQADMLERFYREAQAGILQHPNIVIVFDLGDEDGVPFIVMEYVNGEPLDKMIASGRALPLIDRLSIIEQVCAALGYAHQRGVVHRDIKPANVIVQPDGHAKIVDFGIARMQNSNAETGLTRTGNVIGTIHYIAPERLKGQPFDGRSDIFSTGVMLYLLLTGSLPFSGEDVTVLQKLVNEPHPPLKTHITGYPPYLDTILDRALAKDPEQRYPSAEEFAADLRAVSEDLKKGRVDELFNDAERLTTDQQFGRAKEVLQQLIKIDAQHTGAKQLLGIVQQKISELQRNEQIRQLVAGADEALASARFSEALASLDQAIKLDPANTGLQAKLEDAKEKKSRQDEIGSLLAEADASRNRGDLTGAMKVLERALHLDQNNTRLRAAYAEFAKQAKLAAQQGQIRGMLQSAQQEISSRRFTAAIEILREVSKLDPGLPDAQNLLQVAVTGQEQERRRKLLEQVTTQVESSLLADQYDQALELVNRAVEQLPTEPSLLQLKTRVAGEVRTFKARQLIDATAARAQEVFPSSPLEALKIVQKALEDLPGEERLLALEDSLRQRLKSLQAEEVRGRYLREAQEAIDRNQFQSAIGILESYQLEFADSTGVSELLKFARTELTQQQQRARIAATATQAKSLIQEERFDEAVSLLDPVCAETQDSSLARLLTEARAQQAEAARKLEALAARVARLREEARLDEAIDLLKTNVPNKSRGTQIQALLNILVTERDQKQVITRAVATARQAIERRDYAAGWEALEGARQAYGESPELARALEEVQTARASFAHEAVGKSVEAARSALLNKEPQAAQTALESSAQFVEFATPTQQTDWRRIRKESEDALRRAGKPATGTLRLPGEADVAEAPPSSRKMLILGIGSAFLVLLAIAAVLLLKKSPTPPPPLPPPNEAYIQIAKAPSGAAVSIDNGTPVQTDASGQASVKVTPGPHHIIVSKDGFASFTDDVNVSAGETYKDNVALAPLPPAEKSGTLTIRGNVEEVRVFVDGVSRGLVRQGKPMPLEEGTHTIKYSAPGYADSDEKSVNITHNKDTLVRFNLAKVAQPPPQPPPPSGGASIISFSATPSAIQEGGQATLQWETKDATSTSIDPGHTTVSPSGQQTVKPASTTTYVLTIKGKDGKTQTQTALITVTAAPPPKIPASIVSFGVNPTSVQQGETATLQWEAKDAVTLSINPDIGTVHPAGQQTIRPSSKTTYTLTAIGNDGQATTRSVTVTVASAPQPPPPSPHVDESALIREAVTRYQSAYNSHNIENIKAAWPGLPSGQERAMRDSFKNNPELSQKVDCPSSSNITGDTAQSSCKVTTTFKSGGSLQSKSINVTFSFVKRDGSWVISSLR
ncbi:MAG TPA: protein kinase [Silvibacterium sp.]|nr:protein kinase [Silvibacterium sp.]